MDEDEVGIGEVVMQKPKRRKTADMGKIPNATATGPRSIQHVTAMDVARRAYALFLARGCEHGHDVNDWLQAERELRAMPSSAAVA